MNYYIGLDLGTSGIKGILVDRLGNVIKSHLEEYNIISIKDGYAEEDPIMWYNATIKVLLKLSDFKDKENILGIAISGQMHGLVILDEFDNVIRNSIIWCDNRTTNEKIEIENKLGKETLKKITGNDAMAQFTLAKLLWVKNNEPDNYKKINKVMLPKDYISYMLTKTFYSEYSDTSGMQILDLANLCYSKELLDKFDIPLSFFPKLIKSDDIRGNLTSELIKITGLKNAKLVGGAGDQACGAIGSGIINSNDLLIVLGSSGVVLTPTDNLVLNDSMQSFSSAIYKKYFMMGVTNGCGTSLKWARDEIFNLDYNKMTELASKVGAGANNLYYLPYLMGERTPILDNDAKGVFFGIKNTTSKGEMIRAIMEGVGYSIKDCYNLITDKKDKVIITGGGAKSILYCKIISSMINKEVIRLENEEGPSLGAAIIAMSALKEYKNIDEAINNVIKYSSSIKPSKDMVDVYNDGYKIYKKIYNNTKEIFKEIKK